MSRTSLFTVVGLAAIAGSIAIAQPAKEKPAAPAHAQPAGQPEMPLPPGWTPEDMKACEAAMTPGPMHAKLTADAGIWHGKNKMWMVPGAPVVESESTTTITPILDGRFVKCEITGDMPGMGPFNGFAIYGFDNVTQKFQSSWIDNCSTAVMAGTGELSSSGDTMTWKYNYTCPISKKPVTFREVQKTTGKDTKTIEMFGIDPKSGKEYKMMEISATRKSGSAMGGSR